MGIEISRGFYTEGINFEGLDTPPLIWDVIYISEDMIPGVQPESNQLQKGLLGRKWDHELIISSEEARCLYRLPDKMLDLLRKNEEVPRPFVDWVSRLEKEGSLKDEPIVSPEYRKWISSSTF